MCFRRFNATHQFGCQSRQGGSVGTVHLVRTAADIDLIVMNGRNAPYVPCMRTKFFTAENLIKFRESQRVSGLILFDSRTEDQLPDAFSEDRRCPNEFTSYYQSDPTYGHCKREEWNKYATAEAISELNLDFPMILMRDSTNITAIQRCFEDFNEHKDGHQPSATTDMLCSLELKTWMVGAKNSKVCMSRSTSGLNFENVGYCDSVASLNLFSTLFKYEKEDKIDDRSVLVLAARIDSLSIFDNAATGASTTLTSLITLFSVMKILREQRDAKRLERLNRKNVLYALFDGEAFDYVGSGRTAFDLGTEGLQALLFNGEEFENLKFFKQHLHSAIEISQATLDQSNQPFYLHTDPLTRDKPTIKGTLSKLIKSLIQPTFIEDAREANGSLPPSSVQQLLAHDLDLPVLVISNHKTDYVNKFYNTFLDDNRTISDRTTVIKNIAQLSESIARTVVTEFLDTKAQNFNADWQLIETLYTCFIQNSKCKFFEDVRGSPSRLSSAYSTYPMYITTTRIELREMVPFHFEYLWTLARLSAYLNGKNETTVRSADDCKELNKKLQTNSTFNWFEILEDPNDNSTLRTACLETTDFISLARSPVFAFDQPNWSLNYSTWTESVWNSPSVRLFVSSSKLQEYFTFFAGLTIFVASLFLSKWVCSKADILFVDLRIDSNVASM